jgi:hypothetical protein
MEITFAVVVDVMVIVARLVWTVVVWSVKPMLPVIGCPMVNGPCAEPVDEHGLSQAIVKYVVTFARLNVAIGVIVSSARY